MNVELSLDPKKLLQNASKFLFRYHFVLFIVTVLGSLAVIILLLSQTLSRANDIDHADPVTMTPFDQKTIETLNQLNTSTGEAVELQFPDGRINPFSE